MKKKEFLQIIFIFLLSSLLYLPSKSQTHKYFVITGKILADSDCLKNSSIQILKNDKKLVSTTIPEHGRFRLELEYNAEYQLVFSTDGFSSKTISVNTGIPKDVNQDSENFPHFLMAVRLFKENQELTVQVQEINYSTKMNCFARVPGIYDVEYVEKGNSISNSALQSQVTKSKMQVYQMF